MQRTGGVTTPAEKRVTIPIHNKDLPERTLRYILKQADISEEEFWNLFRK